MIKLLNHLIDTLLDLSFFEWFLLFVDIYFVWIIIYLIFNLIKLNIRTMQILKGLVLIYIINFASALFNLHALNALVDVIMRYGILGFIIIFQPEIRGALEQIGINSAKGNDLQESKTLYDIVLQSFKLLSKKRIGALIVIEQTMKLEEFTSSATIMDSKLSVELLTTIFIPTTALHDGAVIIRDDKIYSAGAYLPLTKRDDINKEFGTRHRAAIGASEITDAIVLVVSEETGIISIAQNGQLERFNDVEKFGQSLARHLDI